MVASSNTYINKTYGQALASICQRFADREALVVGDERYSFAQIKHHIDQASRHLIGLGLAPGDKVALWLPNRAEFLWYWMGAAQIGLVVVVLNTRLKLPEVSYQIEQSESRALIIPGQPSFRDFPTEIATLCPELRTQGAELSCAALPNLRRVIICDPPSEAMSGLTPGAHFSRGFGGAIDDDLPLADDPDAPALISYSSGTTALPKGALITHCVWRKGYDIGERADLTEHDRLYLCIPLFGSMAMMNAILPLWTRGGAVVLAERFKPDLFLLDVQRERCTCAHFLPPMVEALAAHPGRSSFDLSALRIGWVLSNDRTVLETVARALGIPGMLTGYGLTETATVLTRNRWDDPLEVRITTQGYALPNVELRIADPVTGAALAPNQAGEIWARGYCITPGYFKKPAETAQAITPDGWFRTGDLGVIDDSGRLAYRGRIGDGYKSRGFNVSPAEVEAALSTHPDVAAAAVVGIPDDRWGAVGVAFIVPELNKAPRADDLMDYLRPRLSSFKLPEMIVIANELPMTAGTGKVQKFKLREQAMKLAAGAG